MDIHHQIDPSEWDGQDLDKLTMMKRLAVE